MAQNSLDDPEILYPNKNTIGIPELVHPNLNSHNEQYGPAQSDISKSMDVQYYTKNWSFR